MVYGKKDPAKLEALRGHCMKMKLKPGLHGDSKVLDLLEPWMFAKESCTEQWSMRGMCGVGSKAGREGPAKPSATGYGATGFGLCRV